MKPLPEDLCFFLFEAINNHFICKKDIEKLLLANSAKAEVKEK